MGIARLRNIQHPEPETAPGWDSIISDYMPTWPSRHDVYIHWHIRGTQDGTSPMYVIPVSDEIAIAYNAA